MKGIVIYILILFFSYEAFAQEQPSLEKLMRAEDQILKNFERLYESSDPEVIDSLNKLIEDDLRKHLSTWDGFYYSWDALNMIGRVDSEDGRVKLLTWHSRYNDNTYKYSGILSYKVDEKSKDPDNFKAIILNDNSADIKMAEDKILAPDNWYGAVYYRLKTFTHRRDTWYAMIGFDFNDPFSNKKIIEILTINRKGEPEFGGEVLAGENQEQKRLIFEYSSEVAMAVTYDEKMEMFVYDHLRPYQPIFEGNYRFYAPDGSYDGLRFEKGVFIKEEDIDARNY